MGRAHSLACAKAQGPGGEPREHGELEVAQETGGLQPGLPTQLPTGPSPLLPGPSTSPWRLLSSQPQHLLSLCRHSPEARHPPAVQPEQQVLCYQPGPRHAACCCHAPYGRHVLLQRVGPLPLGVRDCTGAEERRCSSQEPQAVGQTQTSPLGASLRAEAQTQPGSWFEKGDIHPS